MEKNNKKLIFFMPSMDGGGVEKNLIIIANYFIHYIKNITLITFDSKFNNNFNKKIKILNVKKNNTKKKYSKYYKYFRCLFLLIKENYKNKNSLIFSFQANIYVLILSSFLRYKVISRSNSSPAGWGSNTIKNIIFKFFFKFAKEIIVNSKEFQNQFNKKYKLKTKLIYNPLNKKEIIEQSKVPLKLNFFNSKKNLKIINIARFSDQKDHETLLKSFKIINKRIKSKLLIIGYGANENKIRNFVSKNNLNKNVKILNFKSNPFNYIKKSDLLVLTSRFEGLPNVLLEAQTLKKYVISSNCPTGPREILLNGELGGLFKIGDYKSLYLQVLNFHKKKSTYNKKISLAFKKLNRFDFKTNCNKYLNLILNYL